MQTKISFYKKGEGEILGIISLAVFAFLGWGILSFFGVSFGVENEGTVTYNDCRQVIKIQDKSWQTYAMKFTCSYSKTQSGKMMSGECVHISNDSSFLGNSHTCATAYVYEKQQDLSCKNSTKGELSYPYKNGFQYPYLGYNDKCYTVPQGAEKYIDQALLNVPNQSDASGSNNEGAGAEGSSPLPTEINQCSKTTVSEVGTRLTGGVTGQNIIGSGSAIKYANGGYQVSYDTVQGIDDSLVGDVVNLCLISIPSDCPDGDNRGKVYTALNERTGHVWQAQDSQHSCGGA